LIILINTLNLWKNSKILTSLPQNFVIDHTKFLCHRIKHILFHLWIKYETIWTNIANPHHWVLFYKIAQWNKMFESYFKTFKNMFWWFKLQKIINILIKKYMTIYWKTNLVRKLFCNIMIIQSGNLRVILGQDIPFVYPNHKCTHLKVQLWHNLNQTIDFLKHNFQLYNVSNKF